MSCVTSHSAGRGCECLGKRVSMGSWLCGGGARPGIKLGTQRGPPRESKMEQRLLIFILNYFDSTGKIDTQPTLKMQETRVPVPSHSVPLPSPPPAVSYRSFWTFCILQILPSYYVPVENIQCGFFVCVKWQVTVPLSPCLAFLPSRCVLKIQLCLCFKAAHFV